MPTHRQRHDPSKSLVGFVVGDVEYAVDIARVREIANPLAAVALPHAPPSVVGVADYRGEVVPVVDLRLRFGLAPAPPTRRTKWIVVDVSGSAARPEGERPHTEQSAARPEGERPHTEQSAARPEGERPLSRSWLVAVVVDAVTEVFGTGGAELRPAPSLGGRDDLRGIAGVAGRGEGLVFVVDTARLRELTEPLAAAGRIGPSVRPPSLPPGAST